MDPESIDFDELGFLSNYILEMAQEEKINEEKVLEQAQKISGHNDVSWINITNRSLHICEMSVPDFSSDFLLPAVTGEK